MEYHKINYSLDIIKTHHKLRYLTVSLRRVHLTMLQGIHCSCSFARLTVTSVFLFHFYFARFPHN